MTDLNNQQIIDLARQIKIKTLANLIRKANAEESLSLADLKVLTELQAEFGEKEEPGVYYDNRAEALKELKAQGYKIGKSKFYKDCTQGLCKMEADGRILEKSLTNYVKHPRSGLKRLDKITEEETGKEKTRVEIEKLTEQVRKLRLEREVMEKKYVLIEDAERDRCALLQIIMTGLDYMVDSRPSEWVFKVFGEYNTDYSRVLRECVQADISEQFNQIAVTGEFEVEVAS